MLAHTMNIEATTDSERDARSTARMWDRMAQKYAKSRIADQAGYERSLARTDGLLKPEHNVLEIGCGTGSTALHHASRVARIVGTDISGEMVRIAREKAQSGGVTNATFHVARADDRVSSEPEFDVVMAHNLFHLVPDLPATLNAAHRSLRPDGMFVSKTPCLAGMNVLIRRVVLPVMQWWYGMRTLNILREDALVALIEDAGFEVTSIEHHGSTSPDNRPYIIARKI